MLLRTCCTNLWFCQHRGLPMHRPHPRYQGRMCQGSSRQPCLCALIMTTPGLSNHSCFIPYALPGGHPGVVTPEQGHASVERQVSLPVLACALQGSCTYVPRFTNQTRRLTGTAWWCSGTKTTSQGTGRWPCLAGLGTWTQRPSSSTWSPHARTCSGCRTTARMGARGWVGVGGTSMAPSGQLPTAMRCTTSSARRPRCACTHHRERRTLHGRGSRAGAEDHK